MEAGELRHRVTIQHFVAGSPQQTGSGAPDGAWTTYLTVYARVEPLTGRALFAAQEHAAEVTHRIKMRYRSGITEHMRAVHEGLYYIVAYVIDPDLRHSELQLYCKQGVVDG